MQVDQLTLIALLVFSISLIWFGYPSNSRDHCIIIITGSEAKIDCPDISRIDPRVIKYLRPHSHGLLHLIFRRLL
nr:triple gene block protein 3 [Miscanthus virus M]